MSPRKVPTITSIMIALAVRQLAQQHGVREGEADPVDAEQRAGDRDRRAALPGRGRGARGTAPASRRPRPRAPACSVAVARATTHSGQRREADDRHRPPVARASGTARSGTRRPSTIISSDPARARRCRRRRSRRPPPGPRRAPARADPSAARAAAAAAVASRRRGRSRARRSRRRVGRRSEASAPPKRRWRDANSARLAANASREKSGQSSSRNTNSE